ncbi:MAG: PEP-CTERM sorting domain-containing protein [Candidatus Omnitrophota bacterium]
MKKFFFLGLVVGLVLSLSSAAHANMLLNSSFETPMGSDADPDNWWGLRENPTVTDVVMKTSATEKYSGSQSGKIVMTANTGSPKNLWAGWGQEVSIGEGQQITASAWLKSTARNYANPKLQLEFKDIGGVQINKTSVAAPTGTFDWTNLSTTVTTPVGTETVLVNLLVEKTSGGASGEFYWDDASIDVAAVPEPASLLLLGSGLVGLLGVSRKKK